MPRSTAHIRLRLCVRSTNCQTVTCCWESDGRHPHLVDMELGGRVDSIGLTYL